MQPNLLMDRERGTEVVRSTENAGQGGLMQTTKTGTIEVDV